MMTSRRLIDNFRLPLTASCEGRFREILREGRGRVGSHETKRRIERGRRIRRTPGTYGNGKSVRIGGSRRDDVTANPLRMETAFGFWKIPRGMRFVHGFRSQGGMSEIERYQILRRIEFALLKGRLPREQRRIQIRSERNSFMWRAPPTAYPQLSDDFRIVRKIRTGSRIVRKAGNRERPTLKNE